MLLSKESRKSEYDSVLEMAMDNQPLQLSVYKVIVSPERGEQLQEPPWGGAGAVVKDIETEPERKGLAIEESVRVNL